jgi:hypothetical protein
MEEIYTCEFCGRESADESVFETDTQNMVDPEEMICEQCYDAMNV